MSDSAPAVQSSTELTDTAAIRVAVKDPPRVRTRARRVEAWLLLFALLIVAFSITLVELGALGSLNVQIFVLMLPLSVLVIGYHILLRIFASNADPIMLPTATLINGIGIAFLYRIDIARDLSGWSSLSVRQVAWTAIALIASAIVLVAIRSHRPLQRYKIGRAHV